MWMLLENYCYYAQPQWEIQFNDIMVIWGHDTQNSQSGNFNVIADNIVLNRLNHINCLLFAFI